MTAGPDKPTYPWPAYWRWRWRCWRARTHCHRAWLAWLRFQSPENQWRREIAEEYLRRVRMSRP